MKTQLYEGMFIINTGNDDESSRNEVLEEIRTELKRQGGSIESILELGKKFFTYQIKKQKDGYYYLIYMNLNPQTITKLLARLKLNGSILRQLILKIDEIPKPEERKINHRENSYSSKPSEPAVNEEETKKQEETDTPDTPEPAEIAEAEDTPEPAVEQEPVETTEVSVEEIEKKNTPEVSAE
ncbi:30S ribosomal protein S6 [bacterium]|nr:30S ribosomal protein S6 [bacterium]